MIYFWYSETDEATTSSVIDADGGNALVNDCSDLPDSSSSGVYNVYLPEQQRFIDVYCDQDTDGGGWTVSDC